MATIKLTTRNAQYGQEVPSQRSIRANFDGPQKGTGWLHGSPRYDVRIKIIGTDTEGRTTVGDTSMVWRRHGNGEGFDKLYSFLQSRLDQDVPVEVTRIE